MADGATLDREALARRLRDLEDGLAAKLMEVGLLRSEIQELKTLIESQSPARAQAPLPLGPMSPEAKVLLFRKLFRGREDVYPRQWFSKKAGRDKPGYSPVCANDGDQTVCDKFRVPCGRCPNRTCVPLDDQAVLDHLRGRHVIGIYPLLPDETCWFLAADFDKDGWMDDLKAFAETCRMKGVPVTLERSRSGKGGHAWVFFETPVQAALARRLGCFLLTETMNRHHQLSMASYDRLFPNQDTMPQGGFGNLIALPLQHEARKAGNTLFLDENLEPYQDPWAYLASVRKMGLEDLERLVAMAARQGRVLGVGYDALEDGYELTPWERPPSGKAKRIEVSGPVPKIVKATVSGQIFVEKAGLPHSLLAEIKRLASFQNPEFYHKQGMRLSTNGTPRIVCAVGEHPAHLSLPRGCQKDLEHLLLEQGAKLEIQDDRNGGEPVSLAFHGQLSELQEAGAKALSPHDIGIFVGPPGTGKTVLGAFMAAARGVNTLVLVHRKPLLEQWRAQLQAFLGLGPKEVGQIGGGKQNLTGRVDVAMIQSLVTREGVQDLVAKYGHVIVDECHHAPAMTFDRVMREVRAKYVLGLTATPFRRDGLQRLLHFQCGEIRFQVPRTHEQPFFSRLVVRETRFVGQGTIQELYSALMNDPMRNELVVRDVRRSLEEGRSPIVLTERREHLTHLEEALRGAAQHTVVLHGGVPAKLRKESLKRLAEVPEDQSRLILGTGRYIGEGFDDPRLDTLFLTMPIAWKGTLIQYAGRLHRIREGKRDVRVYDYLDSSMPVFRKMFEKRMRSYRSMGYRTDDPAMESRLFLEDLDIPSHDH